MIHIFPANDESFHDQQSAACDCKPCIFMDGGQLFVVHSWSEKLSMQEAERIINIRREAANL